MILRIASLVGFMALGAPILPAQAQMGANQDPNFEYYPWCAVGPASMDRDYRNCGYVSYAQCMEAVRGQTGLCVANTWQTKPAANPARERPSRKR